MITQKRQYPYIYPVVMGWLRCRLSLREHPTCCALETVDYLPPPPPKNFSHYTYVPGAIHVPPVSLLHIQLSLRIRLKSTIMLHEHIKTVSDWPCMHSQKSHSIKMFLVHGGGRGAVPPPSLASLYPHPPITFKLLIKISL